MRNRDKPAKPIFDKMGKTDNIKDGRREGLTKLEYAAIHILAALNSNSDTQFHGDNPKDAIEQASSLFNLLELEQDNDKNK